MVSPSVQKSKIQNTISGLTKNCYISSLPSMALDSQSRGPIFTGQIDSPELPETPEITEIIEKLIKVTKHLTKLKETLTNYVWENPHFEKQ